MQDFSVLTKILNYELIQVAYTLRVAAPGKLKKIGMHRVPL